MKSTARPLVKSFEEACEDLKRPATLPDVSMLPAGEQKFLLANYKLSVIAKSLNKDAEGNEFKPGRNDDKWFPWFWLDKDGASGSGLSFRDCGYGRSDARVASRLNYRSEELAEYAGKTFIDLYADLILFRD